MYLYFECEYEKLNADFHGVEWGFTSPNMRNGSSSAKHTTLWQTSTIFTNWSQAYPGKAHICTYGKIIKRKNQALGMLQQLISCLNPNLVKSRLPTELFSVVQSLWAFAHRTTVILSCSVEDSKTTGRVKYIIWRNETSWCLSFGGIAHNATGSMCMQASPSWKLIKLFNDMIRRSKKTATNDDYCFVLKIPENLKVFWNCTLSHFTTFSNFGLFQLFCFTHPVAVIPHLPFTLQSYFETSS